jgi:prophage tail gpP-like protein
MPKPTPGKQYTVQTGDTVERIAAIAYGDASKAANITRSNQAKLITPGITILIPLISAALIFAPPSDATGLSLYIDGSETPTENLRIFKSLDALADVWTATIAWQYGDDPDLDKKVRPYSYAPATVYVNQKLAISGKLYKTHPGIVARSEMSLEGWSSAADIIDSTLKPPYEANKITLRQRVEDIAAVFSIKVESDLEVDGQFDRVTAGATESAGGHLLSLASQRGALINSDPDGTLRIFKVNPDSEPVGTIEEGEAGFSGFDAEFDGRARWNSYKFLSQTPGDSSANAVAIDEAVPITRFKTFKGNDTTKGETQKAADWRKTKALADALTIPIRARGFVAPNGEEWEPGQMVTLISPTLFMPKGFEMLIRATDMIQATTGDVTILHLVPPAVYTGEEIAEPWANG